MPLFGIQWQPDVPERQIAERVITFLENEGLLYVPLEWEHPDQCFQSANEIRDGLTGLLTGPRETRVFANANAIRMACRDFMYKLRQEQLEQIGYDSMLSDGQKASFYQSLGALRTICGIQIACLAVQYGFDLDERFASILPAQDQEDTR